MLVDTFVHLASDTVGHKINLKCFFVKKDFLQHVQVKQFLPSFRAPLNIMKILPL